MGVTKGWTDNEEADIQKLMATGLDRIKAIQLWKRCGKDVEKAIKLKTSTEATIRRK